MQVSLKGLVASKFGSAEKFADAIGWSGRKARDIVSGRQPPTIKDMEQMAKVLDIENEEEFCNIFFRKLSTMWTGPVEE